jgi:glycerol-3-phosphate cytidylyltransferase-like family protein
MTDALEAAMTNPIILADGVFDPLHAQHVEYLRMATLLDPSCALVVHVSAQSKRAELLPRVARAQLVSWLRYVSRAAVYPSTLEALRAFRPRYYVKGADWRARGIPVEEQAFCDEEGVQVRYVDTAARASSTELLRVWAARTAADGVADFEAKAAAQEVVPFDAAAQGYLDATARAAIEGQHPDILAGLCRGKTILDYGCGPGHVVLMLRERGANAVGFDPYLSPRYDHCYRADIGEAGDREYDVVVCREVLEHIPVREWGAFVHHLFRVARERVYITTRFTDHPAHPYDLTAEPEVDPSHITKLPQAFLRALCVVNGGRRDLVWERALDWQQKGRVLVYEVGR